MLLKGVAANITSTVAAECIAVTLLPVTGNLNQHDLSFVVVSGTRVDKGGKCYTE